MNNRQLWRSIKDKNFMINDFTPDINILIGSENIYIKFSFNVLYTNGPLHNQKIIADILILKDYSVEVYVKMKNPKYNKNDKDDNEFYYAYRKLFHSNEVLPLFKKYKTDGCSIHEFKNILVDKLLIDVLDYTNTYYKTESHHI